MLQIRKIVMFERIGYGESNWCKIPKSWKNLLF